MNTSRYFENTNCEYYGSCHGGKEKNCLFCYCPLYFSYPTDCLGSPKFLKNGVKDCSDCFFPHDPNNYERITEALKKRLSEKKTKQNKKSL